MPWFKEPYLDLNGNVIGVSRYKAKHSRLASSESPSTDLVTCERRSDRRKTREYDRHDHRRYSDYDRHRSRDRGRRGRSRSRERDRRGRSRSRERDRRDRSTSRDHHRRDRSRSHEYVKIVKERPHSDGPGRSIYRDCETVYEVPTNSHRYDHGRTRRVVRARGERSLTDDVCESMENLNLASKKHREEREYNERIRAEGENRFDQRLGKLLDFTVDFAMVGAEPRENARPRSYQSSPSRSYTPQPTLMPPEAGFTQGNGLLGVAPHQGQPPNFGYRDHSTLNQGPRGPHPINTGLPLPGENFEDISRRRRNEFVGDAAVDELGRCIRCRRFGCRDERCV